MKFKSQDKIVLIITGSGLKAMQAWKPIRSKIHQTSLSKLEKTMNSLMY
jgi:threonine synthase